MSKPNKKKQKEVVGWALQSKISGNITNVYIDKDSARAIAGMWGGTDKDKVIKVRIIPYK